MVGWIDAHGERLQPGSQVCRVMEKERYLGDVVGQLEVWPEGASVT